MCGRKCTFDAPDSLTQHPTLDELPANLHEGHNTKMIVLWIALHFLHHGYALLPVTTVQLGEPATFTCGLPQMEILPRQVHWYKQNAGDTLKVIATVRKSATLEYAPDFPKSRWEINNNSTFSNLIILRTIQEDEGMYHCAVSEWLTNPVWIGTHLLIEGKIQSTSNSSVGQRSTASFGTKLDIHGQNIQSQRANTVIFLLCAVLAISLIVIAILTITVKKNNTEYYKAVVYQGKNIGTQKSQQKDEDMWCYSAAVFTVKTDRDATRDAKSAERKRERIYTAVKAFGLD